MDEDLAELPPAPPGERFRAYLASSGPPSGPGWIPAATLFGEGLDEALDTVRASRGTGSDAVAGVLLLEQYAQRVMGPVLTHAVDPTPEAVHLRLEDGRFADVAFAPSRVPAPGPAGLEPAVDAVHRRIRSGRRAQRGALAPAVAVTYLHLSWPREDHAHHVPDALRVLAAHGLADLVHVEATPVEGQPWMYCDRRTCCLAFRTTRNAERALRCCATCPIVPEDERRALFGQAVAAYVRRRLAETGSTG